MKSTNIIVALMVLLGLSASASAIVLVGGDVLNGNFNTMINESTVDAQFFDNTADWVNLSPTGNQAVQATRANLDFDGSRNVVMSGGDSRMFGLDTGHTISAGEDIDIGYVWRDALTWVDSSTQVQVTLFVTDDNTINGTRTDLVVDLSGLSTLDSTYEEVDHDGIYVATAEEAGKTLFVVFRTTADSVGFGRLDNFTLEVGTTFTASGPTPNHGSEDVLVDTLLSWTPGMSVVAHDVYFGPVFEDVNNADTTTPLGVLVSAGQDANAYDVADLTFGQTYYWRVDETKAAPDNTVLKGDIWSFTAEPYSIQIPGASMTVTASSSSNEFSIPEETVNGSGLGENDTHDIAAETMWFSAMDDLNPWIQYEFDTVKKLDTMKVWNSNGAAEDFVGYGVKVVQIEYSVDGQTWEIFEDVNEFSRAPGNTSYDEYDEIALGGLAAKRVRLNIQSNWGGFVKSYSLSEVQFSAIPAAVRTAEPASGSVAILPDAVVSWRAGRGVVQHIVYVGTDPNAVASGLALSTSTSTNSLDLSPLNLELGQTYYWRVDEVNEAETTSVWVGPVWNFKVVESLIIDNFEGYTNESPNRPFQKWLDGFGYSADEFFPAGYGGNGTGSGVGHDIWTVGSPHYNGLIMESTLVKSGNFSMPLYFNNANGLSVSEAQMNFDQAQDWTANGIKSLAFSIHGDSDNTGQLYLKINNTKVIYEGFSNAFQRRQWLPWIVDLTTVGDVQNVTSLTIGIEGAGATGVVYVDDMGLSPQVGELITPVIPSHDGLVGAWHFDEGSGTVAGDSSGNGRTATIVDATWETGQQGSALSFNGSSAYVNIDGYKGINAFDGVQQAFSISNWVKTTLDVGDTEMVTWGASSGTATRLTWRIHEGRLRTEHNAGNLRGNTYVNDDEWHHVCLVVTEGANLRPENTKIYVDGQEDTYFSGDDDVYNLVAEHDVRIGMSGPQDGRYFTGLIDDVRVYGRSLFDAEVLGLAGITQSIPKSF